jgi:hypothetical protein
VKIIYSLLLCSSCAAFPSSQGGECSETSLGLIVAECKLKVDRECVGFGDLEKCPAVHECDARVDAWEKCK